MQDETEHPSSRAISSPSASHTFKLQLLWEVDPLCSTCHMWDTEELDLVSHLCFASLHVSLVCVYGWPQIS